MKLTATLNQGNFKKKLHNLRNLNYMFQQLAGHVCMFVMHQMQDWELNFNPVRRISGNLAQSPTVDIQPYSAVLRMRASIAPYGEAVAKRIKIKYGHNYMSLAWLRVGEAVLAAIQEEWHRAVSIIEKGGNYVYNNPFYTAI